jgi:polysaccharide pyruvyl transferase CsaB
MAARVLLSGYYGYRNAGDEAVLAAILQTLRTHGGNPDITVLSGDPSYTERTHSVRAVRRKDLFRALPECDVLFQGGGSLLQDVTSARSLYYYLYVIVAARIIRRPVFLYAQGIGPLRRPASRAAVRTVLNHVQAITLRDRDSKTVLADVGVTRPPVYVTADPVWALEPAPADRAGTIWSRQGLPSNGRTIALALRDWPAAPELDGVAADAATTLQSKGFEPVLFPMQRPGDEQQALRISGRMPRPAPVLSGDYHPADLMALAARADLLVGMRLHALIFAAASGVPVLALNYDPKVETLAHELGDAPKVEVEGLTAERLAGAVEAAWETRETDRKRAAREVERLRDGALSTARLAKEFVAKATG